MADGVRKRLNADVGIAGDNDRNQALEFWALYHINDLHNFWFGYRYLQGSKPVCELSASTFS